MRSDEEEDELLAENQRLREEVRKLSRLRTEEMERAVEPELSNHVGARAEFTSASAAFWSEKSAVGPEGAALPESGVDGVLG